MPPWQALKKDIDSRLGAAASLATNSIQRTVGSVVYQGTYNTANWYGEVSALPLNVTSGSVGDPIWQASDHVPAWDMRKILSYNGSAGIVFEDGNLSATQTSLLEAGGLGTPPNSSTLSAATHPTCRQRRHPANTASHLRGHRAFRADLL